MINKGDRVRCINNFGIWTMQLNAEYTVLDTRDNTIQVTGRHGGTNWYKKDRFVKVKQLENKQMNNSNVRVGDTVVRISGTGLRVGKEYVVLAVRPDGAAIRLKGEGMHWYCMSTFSIVQRVKPQQGVLTEEQVFKHLATGVELEYFFENTWHKIDNPKGVSIQFIQTTQFRKKRVLIEVNGIEVPKNNVSSSLGSVGYSISFNKRAVFKAPRSQLIGKVFWNDPNDAQEALVAVLKPFGIEANPLNSNLLES